MPRGQRDHLISIASVLFGTFCCVAAPTDASAQQGVPVPTAAGAPAATSFTDQLNLVNRFRSGVLRLERMGESYPRAPVGSSSRAVSRVCTDRSISGLFAWQADRARSGEFAVEPLLRFGKPTYKLSWEPVVADTNAVLTITAYRLDSAVTPVRFEQRSMARSKGGILFYATYPVLPSGVWALVGQAGSSWGCFVVQLSGRG